MVLWRQMNKFKTMRAACYDRYGAPELLKISNIAIPSCTNDQVLVKVHYSTVNRTDCGFLRGQPFVVRFVSGLTKPRSTTLGCEFAGEVVEVGNKVHEFEAGDRVCGFKDDDFGFGGHAEYTTMNVNGLLGKIPEHLSYAQAAPALEGAHYALSGIRSTKIVAGQQILVNGGTGAIGSAAIQIIHALGAEVTAVCGPSHIDTVKQLGAIKVIDYLSDDFTKLDSRFDVVFDAVGKSTFGQCKNILKPNGIYLSTELGPYAQNPFLALYTAKLSKKKVHFPIPKNLKTDADYLCDLLQTRQYLPLIDRTYTLDEIIDAFHYVESGEKIGNVLLKIC